MELSFAIYSFMNLDFSLQLCAFRNLIKMICKKAIVVVIIITTIILMFLYYFPGTDEA